MDIHKFCACPVSLLSVLVAGNYVQMMRTPESRSRLSVFKASKLTNYEAFYVAGGIPGCITRHSHRSNFQENPRALNNAA